MFEPFLKLHISIHLPAINYTLLKTFCHKGKTKWCTAAVQIQCLAMLTCQCITPIRLASPPMTKLASNGMHAAIPTKTRHTHTDVMYHGKAYDINFTD
jgi:hypothetical protein